MRGQPMSLPSNVRFSALTVLLLSSVLFMSGLASAGPVQQVTLNAKPKEESKSLLGFADLTLEYTVRTDLNQNVNPHTYGHVLDLSISKEIFEKYTAFLSAGVEYTTAGTTVYRGTSTEAYYSPHDVSLGVLTGVNLGSMNSLKAMLTEDILTSDDSRYFGYLSVTGVRGILSTRFTKWLSLRQTADGVYILNRYRYAPVSSGEIQVGDINPDSLVNYAIGPIITLFDGLRIGASMAVRGTHYLDGTNTYGFGNSYLVSYSGAGWSIWARYLNKGYADRGETNLWFADSYRRLASGGISIDF